MTFSEEVEYMANKAALIERVAEKTGLTKKDATVAVDAVLKQFKTH